MPTTALPGVYNTEGTVELRVKVSEAGLVFDISPISVCSISPTYIFGGFGF